MSGPVTQCQSCANRDLESVLFLGFQPLANAYRKIGEPAQAETTYPLELLRCPKCELVQLGYVVPAELLFPADYPYTSGTTKALRDNFADLAACAAQTLEFGKDDLVLDIGSNDGTLLKQFGDTCCVLGVTPENAADAANLAGIPTAQAYFSAEWARDHVDGLDDLFIGGCRAKLITTTNCFAHIPDPHDFLEGVTTLLAPGGVFVVEVQYLYDTLEKNYFDCIYHEHLRYYTLLSLSRLLHPHGLVMFRVQRIPTHGGSIRVWVCRSGERAPEQSVPDMIVDEIKSPVDTPRFQAFRRDIELQRIALHDAITARYVDAVGAPSRASTLVHFCGLEGREIDLAYEAPGSQRIGRYMPGTRIEVQAEPDRLDWLDADDGLLLLSHHIADDLIPKLRTKGFRGKFIVPLPEVRVIDA